MTLKEITFKCTKVLGLIVSTKLSEHSESWDESSQLGRKLFKSLADKIRRQTYLFSSVTLTKHESSIKLQHTKMKFLICTVLFLFVALPNLGNCADLQCFISGECTNSDIIDIVPSNDEFECLENCQNNANCTWFTFYPDARGCLLVANCGDVEDTFCSNCVSGEKECEIPKPVCSVQGILFFNTKFIIANAGSATDLESLTHNQPTVKQL